MSSPQLIRILLAVLSVLAAIPPSSRSFSLNLTDFSRQPVFTVCPRNASDGISLLGEAYVDPQSLLQLTRTTSGSGRAYLCKQIHFWDRSTNEVTNFTTTFSFDVDFIGTIDRNISGGMTFYLSPVGWPFQPNSYAYSLGLGNEYDFPGIVAVEFDSEAGSGIDDARVTGSHIGIDSGSLRSLVNKDIGPDNSFTSGVVGEAVISYDSAAARLSVSLSFNGSLYEISYVLDLSTVLPEWVSVGFSGSTGGAYDMKRIRTWSFESSLDDVVDAPRQEKNNTAASAADSPAAATPPHPGSSSNWRKNGAWSILALIFMPVALILFVILCCTCCALAKIKKERGL